MLPVSPFDPTQIPPLRAFLDAPERPKGTMKYWECVGFLFVVASAPELIRPSLWLPKIYTNDGNDDASTYTTEEMLGALMSLYNELNRQVQESDVALLPGCEFRDQPMANMEEDAPICQWARGFVKSYHWLGEQWSEYIPEKLEDEAGSHMLVLSFFSDAKIAQTFLQQGAKKDVTVEVMAANIQSIFIDAMQGFARLGASIQKALMDHSKAANEPARNDKIGRNDPCPCGSGKKYKKCCYETH